mgnify:CR=1 FL=1
MRPLPDHVIDLSDAEPVSSVSLSLIMHPWFLPFVSVCCALLLAITGVVFLTRGGETDEEDECDSIDRHATQKTIINLARGPLDRITLGLPVEVASRIDVSEGIRLAETQLSSSSLRDLLESSTSNSRRLKWTHLSIPPNRKFPLHSHPNLEIVFCLKGMLKEVKWVSDGSDNLSREDLKKLSQLVPPANHPAINSDYRSASRNWRPSTLSKNSWLVNEVASVHMSFTGEEGCELLVLWSGAHADFQRDKCVWDIEGMCDCYLRGDLFDPSKFVVAIKKKHEKKKDT